MKLGIEDMPISPYQSLTITREVEELIDEEKSFIDMSPLPEPLILETDIPGLGTGVNVSIFLGSMPPPTPPMPGRMGVDLLLDSVSLGWYRPLRVLRYVVTFISKIQNNLGKK